MTRALDEREGEAAKQQTPAPPAQATKLPPAVLAAGNQAVAAAIARMPTDTIAGGVQDVVGGLGQVLTGELEQAVGKGGKNQTVDAMLVKSMLDAVGYGGNQDLGAAIAEYQREALGWPDADGRVDPHGKTFAALKAKKGAKAAPAAPKHEDPAAPAGPAEAKHDEPAPAAQHDAETPVSADSGAIEQALKDAAELQTKALKTKGSHSEEGGPERKALVAKIGQIREALNKLPDSAERIRLFGKLMEVAPFYTQQWNKDIIGKAMATTCNCTTVAMGIELLGKTASEYKGNWDLMHRVESWAQQDQKEPGLNFTEGRLPDFMQLVAIIECLGGNTNPTDAQINDARMTALGQHGHTGWVASGSDPIITMYKRFGVEAELIVNPSHNELQKIGSEEEQDGYAIWKDIDKRGRNASDADVAAGGKNVKNDAAHEQTLHLDGYKKWAMKTFTPKLQKGLPVNVGQYMHWVRLQGMTDDHVIVDDPGADSRSNRKVAWEEARAMGMFWDAVAVKG